MATVDYLHGNNQITTYKKRSILCYRKANKDLIATLNGIYRLKPLNAKQGTSELIPAFDLFLF